MGFETTVADIEAIEGAVETAERVLTNADTVLMGADEALQIGEGALAHADEWVQRAEHGIEVGRSVLPKVAIGLAVVGAGVLVAIAIRKSRAGKAAAREEVLEQPEESVDGAVPAEEDSADATGEDS